MSDINSEIGKFNQKLAVFARSNRTVTLSTNDNILISEQQSSGATKHYENTTQLSNEGKSLLLKNLRKGMMEAIQVNVMSGGVWKIKKSGGRSVPNN